MSESCALWVMKMAPRSYLELATSYVLTYVVHCDMSDNHYTPSPEWTVRLHARHVPSTALPEVPFKLGFTLPHTSVAEEL